jgi:3-hydroxybutyrate dehydrogenase
MLKQKSAIVTGSTSGIGLGIARALAQNGADILLNGFGNAEEIEFTRAEMQRQFGVEVRCSGADMSRPDQVRAMVGFAQAEFGKVDIVVNNAGIQHVAPIEEFADDKWDAVMAINLSSAFHVIKAVTPDMKARRFGRIINVASAHGLTASPFKSAYVAAKHGLIGLSKTVALASPRRTLTLALPRRQRGPRPGPSISRPVPAPSGSCCRRIRAAPAEGCVARRAARGNR